MLGVLCATRSRPWIFSFLHHSSSHHHHTARLAHITVASSSSSLSPTFFSARRNHSSQCKLQISAGGGAASIWHAIMPCGGDGFQRGAFMVHHDHELKGEGSWNVAWDARPARWLHRSDSAWLLFGVRAWLAPPPVVVDVDPEVPLPTSVISPDEISRSEGLEIKDAESDKPNDELSSDYRVTGVLADGRCLFRALAHGACLKNGEEAPNENRQRELADELRAKVAEELLKRRKETEWFIEGDFDTYVTRIQQSFVWGGEPELLMASHVLKTPIFVFMRDPNSIDLVNIAKYGEEYMNDEGISINVLFHRHGHYELLETLCPKLSQKQ
ncbi:unnamed protein product [Trifolium pratense]|uniref:Uncharacterized protein n=1 Tax=Trifolium pratense TaxID=57577 RepID=A0ACB0IEE9_TRIPR|nr:unnamed protein product [Trifolium pratense]